VKFHKKGSVTEIQNIKDLYSEPPIPNGNNCLIVAR